MLFIYEVCAFESPLPIDEVCARIQQQFDLEPFEQGADDRAAWGVGTIEGVPLLVSQPHQMVLFPEWRDLPDAACNFGLALWITECPTGAEPDWAHNELMPRIAQGVADVLDCPVVHQHAWVGDDKIAVPGGVFQPSNGAMNSAPGMTSRSANGLSTSVLPAVNGHALPERDYGVHTTTVERLRPRHDGPLDFVFVVHPRNFEDLIRPFAESRFFSSPFVVGLGTTAEVIVASGLSVERDGQTLHGELLAIPYAPQQLLDNLPLARAALRSVVDYADRRDTRVMGLGALLPSITRAGSLLAAHAKTVGITTGHTFTALAIADYVRRIEAVRGPATVAVIGAAGSTGRAATRCLLRDCPSRPLVLVDVPHRLGAIPQVPGWDDRLHTRTSNRADIRRASIVVCVTNAPGAVLSEEDFAPGSVILDDAQPENVSSDVLLKRPDLTVVKCLAQVSGLKCPFDFGLFAPDTHSANQELTFTCLAETILLAAIGHTGPFTVGDPLDEQLRYLEEMAPRYGIRTAPFHSYPHLGFIDPGRK